MDAHHWKLLVDKAILRTKSRDLLWSETSEGPDKTLSFGASIDDSTTLNIWGYKTNYSYELHLTRETAGEPFEERKRVTTKKNSEGINFKGLFETVQAETKAIVRDNALAAVLDYLADPAVTDPEKIDALRDTWSELGDDGYFLYSQDEKILTAVRDMTVAGSVTWSADKYSGGEPYFRAEIGDLLSVMLQPVPTSPRASGDTSYVFTIMGTGDETFWPDVELHPGAKQIHHPLWLIADEIHKLISKTVTDDEAKFNKIVRDDIIHDILSSLDGPRS